jgi:hypothetical protein
MTTQTTIHHMMTTPIPHPMMPVRMMAVVATTNRPRGFSDEISTADSCVSADFVFQVFVDVD